MTTLVPKGVKEESWRPLVQLRDYAVLCNPGESVFFKFGAGRGLYVGIDPSSVGRIVNSLDFENGDPSLLGKLAPNVKAIIGRTGDATIKVMHAMISRTHLELTLKGNVLVVKDCGSTNGTYIHTENPHFDIHEYLEHHPLGSAPGDTLNWVQVTFGVGITDFLKDYSQ